MVQASHSIVWLEMYTTSKGWGDAGESSNQTHSLAHARQALERLSYTPAIELLVLRSTHLAGPRARCTFKSHQEWNFQKTHEKLQVFSGLFLVANLHLSCRGR